MATGSAEIFRRRLEVGGVAALIIGYVVFQRAAAARAWFIIPAILLGGAALFIAWRWGGRSADEYGFRHANLRPTALWSAVVVGVAGAAGVVSMVRAGHSPPIDFWVLLVLYPVWGVAQQTLFQGVLHEGLLALGFRRSAALWTTVAFVAVHYPSTELMWLSAAGGAAFSAIYGAYRNVLPLGIAHGLSGAIVYVLVLGRAPLARFFGG